MKKQVVLDTDIGIDMDDTWALGLLLRCEELELKLITVATGDVDYRARIVGKFLDNAGYNIPIGIGIASPYEDRPQFGWVSDYNLSSYNGTVYQDGVGAMIDTIKNSDENVTIICIGPLTNIAEAMRRSPEISQKVEIVSMLGSIYKAAEGKDGKIAEWNVRQDITSAQQVFKGQWPICITPLDVCGIIKLRGDKYSRIFKSDDKICKLILENYKIWDDFYGHGKFEAESSILYDTATVYAACSYDNFEMESHKLKIDNSGCMQACDDGKEVNCAINWKDLGAFENYLVDKYLGNL